MSIDKKSSYYDHGGIETFAIMMAKLTHEQLEGYLLGQVIKYATRMNFKGSKIRDSEKLKIYADLLATLLKEDE